MATHALLGALLLGSALGAAQDGEAPDPRPPIAQHLADWTGLDSPMGVAVTDDGTVLVAEGVAGRVVRVDREGARRVVIEGLRGARDLELGNDGAIWVVESWAGRVSVHSADGERLTTLGEGVLFRPRGLELDGERVYVADEGAHRVEVFTLEGEHLFGFGGHGFGEGELVLPADPTNRFADDPRAQALGRLLFFDTELSSNGEVSCATCHDPARGFTDGKRVANTIAPGPRRTPHLWNVAYNRWFFLDGRTDSLWAQALEPIENAIEMGGDRLAVAHRIARDPELRAVFEELRGLLPPLEDSARFPAHARPVPEDPTHPHAVAWAAMTPEDRDAIDRVFADVGKVIAAHERRIVSRDAPFDRFVEGLRENDPEKLAALDPAAQRGLKLFLGKGQCRLCHLGPNFTDGEFHGLGLATELGEMPTDPGRYEGVSAVLGDVFNARGPHSDDPEGEAAEDLVGMRATPANWGEFKTPSLRNVAERPPYMHAGQFATLEEVLHFYSTLEGAAPLHQHQEQILQPRNFEEQEIADLVSFVRSLTGSPPGEELLDPSRCRRASVLEGPQGILTLGPSRLSR